MKKIPLLLKPFPLLTLAIFCLAASCQKPEKIDCSGYPDEYWEISPDAQWKIPYTGTDTLVFLHRTDSSEDTVTFIGQGKRYYNEYEDGGSAGDPCRWLITKEAYEIIFKSDRSGMNMTLNLISNSSEGRVSFKINEYSFSREISFINWIFSQGYYDEFVIEGIRHYQVNILGGNNNSLFYYTTKNGLIYLEVEKKGIFKLII
jgi:hypothetical protein